MLGAQVLAEPITRLTSVAARVAAGELTVRAEPASGDEIGTLARTFNTMTGRLEEMVSTLEQRVSERTGQLQAAALGHHIVRSGRGIDRKGGGVDVLLIAKGRRGRAVGHAIPVNTAMLAIDQHILYELQPVGEIWQVLLPQLRQLAGHRRRHPHHP